jgi:hypothetical protein
MFGYEYQWTDRLRLWGPAAPLAESPNRFEAFLQAIHIPEILTLLAIGVVVALVLEALGQRAVSKMALVIAVFGSASLLLTGIASLGG